MQFFKPPKDGRLVLFAALNKALYLSSIGSMAGIFPLLKAIEICGSMKSPYCAVVRQNNVCHEF